MHNKLLTRDRWEVLLGIRYILDSLVYDGNRIPASEELNTDIRRLVARINSALFNYGDIRDIE